VRFFKSKCRVAELEDELVKIKSNILIWQNSLESQINVFISESKEKNESHHTFIEEHAKTMEKWADAIQKILSK